MTPSLASTMPDSLIKSVTKGRDAAVAEPAAAAKTRIPIGVIGLNFGRHIANSQLATGSGAPFFKLAALCDIDQAKVAELASALGVKA